MHSNQCICYKSDWVCAWAQTEIHWYGWIAMTFYICAFVFYMYVRIAHSLDLGPGYIWYGIYLLCVEVLGFTTTIIYGLNLLWNPVIEQFPEDPSSPGRPQVGFVPLSFPPPNPLDSPADPSNPLPTVIAQSHVGLCFSMQKLKCSSTA